MNPIVVRWRAKLKIREALLSRARKQRAYWEREYKRALAGSARARTCADMLGDRRRKVSRRERQVAAARAVIARHTKPPLRERAFAQAIKLVGVTEKGGNNRGPEVEKIIHGAGGRTGDSWCGWFVAYCYRLAGSKITSWQLGAVRLMASAGLLKVRNPQRGHVVRFNFSGAGDNHTGLFDKWLDREHGVFRTIEGNTDEDSAQSDGDGADGVRYRTRSMNQVHDFLRFPR